MKTTTAVLIGAGLVIAYVLYDRSKKPAPARPGASSSTGAGTNYGSLIALGTSLWGSLGGKPTSGGDTTYQGPPGAYDLDSSEYQTAARVA